MSLERVSGAWYHTRMIGGFAPLGQVHYEARTGYGLRDPRVVRRVVLTLSWSAWLSSAYASSARVTVAVTSGIEPPGLVTSPPALNPAWHLLTELTVSADSYDPEATPGPPYSRGVATQRLELDTPITLPGQTRLWVAQRPHWGDDPLPHEGGEFSGTVSCFVS